ncbi:MAG TPA: class I SAM-dependent methyltransferase [Candidatus Acidoferrales bacterium]|nr:class I SAM-dependent methyltransferase [Candidatus Acidoferrales bacterium]
MNTEIRRFLKQLEEHGKTHDAQEPEHSRKLLNLEPDTAEIVSILACSSRAKHVLEIGTSNGYSTIWLAASVGPAGGRVVSVERSREKWTMARDNLLKTGLLQYVDLQLGEATEIVRGLPGPFDFVFFDADRTSAPEQLAVILSKLAPPALILADNVSSHPTEIAGYLAMVKSLKQLQHVVIPVGKGLSVALTAS